MQLHLRRGFENERLRMKITSLSIGKHQNIRKKKMNIKNGIFYWRSA